MTAHQPIQNESTFTHSLTPSKSADHSVWFEFSLNSSSFDSFVKVISKQSTFFSDDNGHGSDDVKLDRHVVVHAMARVSVAVRAGTSSSSRKK